MSQPHLVRFQSIAALRSVASDWNDLWQRSPRALPTSRAEFIADWLAHFAPQAKFAALAVEHEGQLVLGLPLVEQRVAKLIRAGSLPANASCWAGGLLVDPGANPAAVFSTLLSELRRLSWPLLWFDFAPLEEAGWREFRRALEHEEFAFQAHERFTIGAIQIAQQFHRDWEAYEAAWSGNHRRHLRKALRRAQSEGGVELQLVRPRSSDEIEPLLREGFEVEHRSWKGAAGSSVLSDPVMWQFYLRQATEMSRRGELELAFLRYQRRAIAFEYGWLSRGVYYTPKVGFDSQFARFSPGQLLRYLLLKQAFSRADLHAVDFLGPLSDATAKWTTQTYPISRLVVATSALGKLQLNAYQTLAKLRRKLRGRQSLAPDLKIVTPVPSEHDCSKRREPNVAIPLSVNEGDA